MVNTAISWQQIEDLPENWEDLSSPELYSLASIWKSQSRKMQKSEILKQFNERLYREWSIETGIIENLYTIDRGTTQILIEKGINSALIAQGTTDKPAEKIVPILTDQREALEALFSFVAQERELSTFYIRELHQIFTRHQDTVEAVDALGNRVQVPLLRGEWKQNPNNPTRADGTVYQYCPPLQVQSEMERLIEMHLDHRDRGISLEVEAAWLHHRFAQIHPFQDGNGRISRALASLVFLRGGWFPLVINRDDRDEYILTLEQADRGDLSPLVQLFSKIQKKAFDKALSLSESVLSNGDRLKQVISAGLDRLKARKEMHQQQMLQQAVDIAGKLEESAEEQFGGVAWELHQELQKINSHYFAEVGRSDESNDFWFRPQIVKIAKELEYYADTRTYRSWVRLKIKEERQTDIIVSFHGLGVEFLGIMAASAFIEYRDRTEEEAIAIEAPHVLCTEVFHFFHTDRADTVIEKFQPWLEEVLLVGLDRWRKQL